MHCSNINQASALGLPSVKLADASGWWASVALEVFFLPLPAAFRVPLVIDIDATNFLAKAGKLDEGVLQQRYQKENLPEFGQRDKTRSYPQALARHQFSFMANPLGSSKNLGSRAIFGLTTRRLQAE